MKKVLLVIPLILLHLEVQAQNPKFDRLEMHYAQRHYRKVYRMSNRLLDKPEYDFSYLPKYYKSISLFQLCQNRHWMLRHKNALEDAKKLFLEVKHSEDGEKIFNAHMYEISWLKNDMISWAADMKRMGYQESFEEVSELVDVLFEEVPEVDAGNSANHVVDLPGGGNTNTTGDLTVRDEIVSSAKKQLGVPYVWAGSSPSGFDCSGFTSYVMKQHGEALPRRAADQYKSSKKLKAKDVQKGDLVFFNNGSGISHVGLVISERGQPLIMIHSSSSKGIIITEVEKSQYWMKRLHGYGTYVN